MIDRIKQIINYCGLSDRAFAIKCGIKQNTFSNQINGVRELSLQTINGILISNEDISAEWLMRGKGESKTAFSIQPEARDIINKYMKKNGKLVFGKYDTFGKAYSVISRKMDELAELAGIRKRVVFYSARKSFVQHGFDLGIALETLEYCIGQSMKTNRPIFNYVRVMRNHADKAMRQIFDSLL